MTIEEATSTPSTQDHAPAPATETTDNADAHPEPKSANHPPPPPPTQPQPPAQAQAQAPPAPKPGPRAARLQQLYGQSLRRTLSKLQWDNLATCYPTVAGRAEPVLRQVQAQMVDKLADKCEKEFENILTARQVVVKLNELESLIADAARRRSSSTAPPTPPHLLPASSILAAHTNPHLASHQSHLNARLQTAQSRNLLLLEDLARQRREVDDLMAALEGAVRDLRGANGVLGEVAGGIAGEARDADAEIAGAG